MKDEKKKNKSPGQKRRNKERGSESEAVKFEQFDNEASKPDNAEVEKRKRKLLKMKKRQNDNRNEVVVTESVVMRNEEEDSFDEQNGADTIEGKGARKLRKKKRKGEKIMKINDVDVANVGELYNEVQEGSNAPNGKSKKAHKVHKVKKKSRVFSEKAHLLEEGGQAEDEVYEISSGDEDCSRGMKKWITEYYQSRPGLDVLQQRIDDFITAHEAQEEQARKERKAQAAEGGWTVVVQRKGRKKTKDSESGITVGSVAPAAVMNKMANKKNKDVGLDFYRFQKREAQRSEIMMLQSKFEQDKKRIQQLRAERKFRPY